MNRSALSFLIVLCLLSAGVLLGSRITVEAAPITIYVPEDYPTIQQAINAALDGDTIFVHNGTYSENIVVNKTVTLIGESEESTIVAAANSSINAVNVTSSNVNISGFKVNNATDWHGGYGIFLDRVNNVTLSHSIVMNNIYGILLSSSENNTVRSNTLFSNEWGIDLDSGSQYNTIADNTMNSNTYYGIILWSSSEKNVVANNTITNNERGITLGYSDYNVIVSNYISNNSIGLELQQTSNNNTIYWNSFINNTVQLGGGQISSSVNALDYGYPSGGNYWSDYAGMDLYNGPYQNITGSDGIGDSPYAINANNTDRYPLMTPYVVPEFAPTLSLLFCMMATMVSIAFYKKRKIRHSENS